MKVLSLLVIALFVVSSYGAFSESEYAERFEAWVQEHGKVYSEDEVQYRFRVFSAAMDFVHEHNSGDSGFQVELNKFADLTNTEFLERYTGFHQPLIRVSEAPTQEFDSSVTVPSSIDWRDYGAVTGVKDQGQCGSCWSFSTTGSVEGIHKLKNGTLISLSEQNLVDCSYSYGNLGCNGGLMDSAFKYIIDNHGIDTEDSYPYTATSSRFSGCDYSSRYIGATISSFYDVKSGSESALQSAVAQQPVSVAIDASNTSFQLYKSGVYYESSCSSKNLDHGVLAAGYGTDGGSDYWLVKNSWGTGWGMSGYIEMARNQGNNCGIATQASYPIV